MSNAIPTALDRFLGVCEDVRVDVDRLLAESNALRAELTEAKAQLEAERRRCRELRVTIADYVYAVENRDQDGRTAAFR